MASLHQRPLPGRSLPLASTDSQVVHRARRQASATRLTRWRAADREEEEPHCTRGGCRWSGKALFFREHFRQLIIISSQKGEKAGMMIGLRISGEFLLSARSSTTPYSPSLADPAHALTTCLSGSCVLRGSAGRAVHACAPGRISTVHVHVHVRVAGCSLELNARNHDPPARRSFTWQNGASPAPVSSPLLPLRRFARPAVS